VTVKFLALEKAMGAFDGVMALELLIFKENKDVYESEMRVLLLKSCFLL